MTGVLGCLGGTSAGAPFVVPGATWTARRDPEHRANRVRRLHRSGGTITLWRSALFVRLASVSATMCRMYWGTDDKRSRGAAVYHFRIAATDLDADLTEGSAGSSGGGPVGFASARRRFYRQWRRLAFQHQQRQPEPFVFTAFHARNPAGVIHTRSACAVSWDLTGIPITRSP